MLRKAIGCFRENVVFLGGNKSTLSKMADCKIMIRQLLVVGLVGVVMTLDTSVCVQPSPNPGAPPLPTLPKLFDAHVEANINNRNFTTGYHIFYNSDKNAIAMYSTTARLLRQEIYNFTSKQYLSIDIKRKTCNVKNITEGSLYFLFGNDQRMFTAAKLLHVNDGEYNLQFQYMTTIRGITVSQWRGCIYMPTKNATMNIDWFFTDPNWHTNSILNSIPVRAHVWGTVPDGVKNRSFDHIYEFSDFHLEPHSHHFDPFQTMMGVYCAGEKRNVPLPVPTSAFHFTAEIVVPGYKSVEYIEEYYDMDLNLTRYIYTPSIVSPFGTNRLTEVHDFTTGVAYVTDNLKGNCSAVPIETTTFDVRYSDPTHVRIRNSREFFYFDKSIYIYSGQREARGILCNVWIGQRNDWPKPNSKNSTWEWYFAISNYTENTADTLQFAYPVMLYMTAESGEYYYNIYNYDELRPSIWTYDISQCFNYTQRQDFSLKLPGNFTDLVQGNVEQFRYALLRAITKAGTVNGIQVSALRIYNIQIDYADKSDFTVTFTILDKAPKVGDTLQPKAENGLQIVAQSIGNKLDSGKFVVRLRSPQGKATEMVAIRNSLQKAQRINNVKYYSSPSTSTTTTSGSSGGAMAGMAVSLLVVFFVLGVLGMYLYYRKQGGAFGPKKFDNEDITSSTN